jgi:prephenate dehydrogenase
MNDEPVSLQILIIGAGLIGTSIGLKLQELGHSVFFKDRNEGNLKIAQGLIGAKDGPLNGDKIDFVFVAVPPSHVGEVIRSNLDFYPNSIFVEVSSVKTNLLHEVQDLSAVRRIIFSHPIAGREVHGAGAAQSDLFLGRTWTLSSEGSKQDLEETANLIKELGATPLIIDPREHDRVLAFTSHLPQIVSSTLALSVESASGSLQMAGQGLRDVTRLAESDPELWSDILLLNREYVLLALEQFALNLQFYKEALSTNDGSKIRDLMESGREIKKELSGKHGAKPRDYVFYEIVIADSPGTLGKLFVDCGLNQINIEDLRLEHSPNQETGLVTLAIAPSDQNALDSMLNEKELIYTKRTPETR